MDDLTIRRSQASDAPHVGELDAPEKTTQRIMYGRGHANVLIETSFLALTAETSKGEIVGFISVNDQPPGDLCEEAGYLEYLCDSFAVENYPTNNVLCRLKAHMSLFLTCFVHKSTASAAAILPEMLSTVFHLLTSMEVVVFPSHNSLGQADLAPFLPHFHLATKVSPNTKGYDEELFGEFDVLVCPGDTFLPAITIRKANIEDHDDLEPILKAQNQALVDTFGDYFLAELIGAQTSHNMCLVAQPSPAPSRAVGIMAISDEVDLGILRDCFDLSMYNNLVKPPSSSVTAPGAGSRLEKILKRRKSPKMIMFGPPASGKTTQVDKLVAQYGLVHITVNVLLRVASRMSHTIGKKVKRHLDKHEEVPDDIVLALLEDRIHESDCITQGWVLDGYPTTDAQALGMIQRGIKPDVVVLFEVPDEEVSQRLVKVSAGMETKPRLKKYHDHAPGILKCFSRDQAVITIDGTKDKEVVTYSLIQALSASDKTKLTRQHRTNADAAPPTFVICGPPAGGKGTQCELLVKQYGVVHLSTGDILRAAIKAGSDLGLKAQTYMNAGELVPDDLIIRVVLERLKEADCQQKGWLLDGFPRTEVQAQTMVVQGIVPQLLIVLDVPDAEVIKRISGRRVDVDTGKTYHLIYNPPPPELKDKVTQRADDTEETIKVRLGHFHTNCGAIVKTFAPTSTVLTVDGMQSKDKITQEIAAALAKPSADHQAGAAGKPSASTPTDAPKGPPKLIICGPPAGGKGTQCELLVRQYGVVHLSTGDILRAAIQAGSDVGMMAKSFMEAGELVPDDLIIRVIVDRIDQPDCQQQGWLLDGFPRTEVQAHAMIGLGIIPDLVIVLDVPASEVIQRISGRRVDPATGKTYHLVFNPPPPGVDVVQRSDDTEETIKVRLTKYNENCGAVVSSFSKTSRVLRVDGMQGKDKIGAEIHWAMNGAGSVKHEAMPPKLVICGPPAGGKGTQCEQLVKKYGVVHLSTGDILRDAVKAGTDTGLRAKKFMDMGELVPDELIMDTILDRLGQPDCVQHGWLLDGFPRNEAQARCMVSFGILPDMVLVLDVADEDVIARISGRRVDPTTGKTYHVTFNPPPADVKDRVVQRSDDTEATVRIRLKTYHLNVNAVLKVFAPLANVVRFDGRAMSSADITAAIFSSIDDARALVDVEGNAFLMTLFCIDDAYLVRSTAFLQFAFSLFPQKEYCLVTVAPLSTQPLVLSNFTLVPPKPASTYSHCLYLLHRDALPFLSPAPTNFSLDIARFKLSESFDQLAPLVETLPPASIATLEDEVALAAEEDEIGLEDNPKHVLFVARIHGVVIALASMSRDHEVTNSLKHYFDIEQLVVLTHHRAKDQAMLTHWVLNPIYACAGRVILKEFMRHFKKTCIFACIAPHAHVSPLIVQDFVLALPRRQIVLPASASNQEIEDAKKSQYAKCALYFFTKRLLSEPKMVVNTRIVVVGASDTGLTLLKRLLHVPYARFTNLTLVSPHGLNVFPSPSMPPDLRYFVRPSLLTPAEVDQYGVLSHARVVVSRLVQIDRQSKAVVLVDNSCLPYDYLVLATGLSDGTTTKLHLTSQYDGDTYLPPSVPTGVHALNDVASAKAAMDAVKHLGGKSPRVVVSGSSAFTLSVLQGVLAMGVTHLTWLKPKPGSPGLSTDFRVLEVVNALVQRHAIVVLDHHELSSLAVNPRTNALEGLHLLSSAPPESPGGTLPSPRGGLPQPTLVPCEVLLCCTYDDADYDAFRAINECGLVYDGRLVVNSRFQTTDPFIYAGGSLCRFSRRFPSALYQQHYSSRECGELLAASLLQSIDPLLGHAATPAEMDVAKKTPPPKFTMPKVCSHTWVGGMQFVHINLPDIPTSLKSLTTEHADGSSYCCLQFDEYGVLATLTYVGAEPVEPSNLQCVVGLHEAYLNCAISSFQHNLVSDWIAFFRQPWAAAIYHDRFQEFRVRLNTALKYDEGIRIVVEEVKRHVAETGDLKEAMAMAQAQAGRGGKALMPTTKKMIELNLLDYLSANREVLNMYFLPRAGGGSGDHGGSG